MPNYFEINAEMYKLWPGKIWTDGHAQIHQTEVVTIMSPSPQAGSTKIVHL